MRFVGYGRVSKVGGREGASFISPKVQRETVERLLDARGHGLADWLEDLDQSGGKWERPQFQEALRRVESGEVNGIAVAKLDRFARSLVDALKAIKLIDAAGGHLISAAEQFDTTTPMGRAMMQISLVFAELERERVKESFEVARERAVGHGIHIASRVVLGYRRKEDRTLEPDPDTAPLVRELFQRRAAGESWASLTTWLDEVAPREGGHWVGPTVARMISNAVYLGQAKHGDYVKKGAHAPLVTRAAWEAAQGSKGRSPRRDGSLLAGVLVCGTCERPMTHSWAGRHVSVYRCQARNQNGRCERPALVTTAKADAYIDYLVRNELRPFVVTWVAETEAVDQATADLETAERELAEYRDGTDVSIIGRDAFNAGLRPRAAKIEEKRVALVEAQRRAGTSKQQDAERAWDDLDVSAKREFIRSFIEKIIVRPTKRGDRSPVRKRLEFVLVGDEPDWPTDEDLAAAGLR